MHIEETVALRIFESTNFLICLGCVVLGGFTLSHIAISKSKELEESNKNMEELMHAAQTADMAKGDFLARMSHEIRTPMNAICGMSELFMDEEKLKADSNVDLILMDYMMPEMDGIEATQIIRKNFDQHISIVALTADAIAGMDEEFKKAGMDDYLSKPIDIEKLVEILERWIPGFTVPV